MASVPSRPPPSGVREVREADTTVGPPTPSEADVRATYGVQTAQAIRARLGHAGAIFVVCIAIASAAETWFHPERSPTVWIVFAVYAVSWLAGLPSPAPGDGGGIAGRGEGAPSCSWAYRSEHQSRGAGPPNT